MAAYTASPNVGPLLGRRRAREQLAEVGDEVELETLQAARQRDRAHHEHGHDAQQADHHHLRDALDALLQPQAAHEEAQHDDHEHPAHQLGGVRQHVVEHGADARAVQAVERARAHLHHERQHPAAHRGVDIMSTMQPM